MKVLLVFPSRSNRQMPGQDSASNSNQNLAFRRVSNSLFTSQKWYRFIRTYKIWAWDSVVEKTCIWISTQSLFIQVCPIRVPLITTGIAQSVQRLATGWMIKGSEFTSRWGQEFLLLRVVQIGSGAHITSYPMGTGALSPKVKRPGREAQLVLRSRKHGSIHPLPHTSSWHSASLAKQRDNFTFSVQTLQDKDESLSKSFKFLCALKQSRLRR
jgi:hypothetical protein